MRKKQAGAKDGEIEVVLRHWRNDVPDDRLAHLIRDTARGLTRALQMRLAEHQVSFGHWAFLRILWNRDGLTQRTLSALAGLQEPTTFTALQAMERLGFVARRQMPDNRKNVYVFLTPKGRALKDTLVPLAEEVNAIAIRGVPPDAVAATRETLLAMIQNLAGDEAAAAAAGRRVLSTRDGARAVASGAVEQINPPRRAPVVPKGPRHG